MHWSLAPLAGLAVTIAGLLLYLDGSQPGVDREPLNLHGGDLRLIAGSGEQHGDGVRVTDFQNGIAVLSSGALVLDSSRLSVLELRLRSERESQRRMRFFWRTTSDPQRVSAIEFPSRDYVRSKLGESVGWHGTVIELGLILFGEAGETVDVDSLILAPSSLGGSLRTLWHDWTFHESWGQTSTNFLFVGASDAAVHLPLIVAVWLAVSVLFVWMLRRRLASPVALVIALGVAGWLLLDVRWTTSRLQQASDTVAFYGQGDRAYLDVPTGEKYLLQRVQTSKGLMRDPGDTVLVLSENGDSDFLIWRALYHYLPTPGFAHTGPLAEAPLLTADYALVVTPVNPEPGTQHSSAQALAAALQRRSGRTVSVIDATEAGVFLRFGPSRE